MTDIQNFLLFLSFSLVLIITPGPDLIYVLTQGISGGRKAGLISAVGVTFGIFVHTRFAAIVLSIILQTSAVAFTVVKMVGAGYLIYLGIKTFISKNELNLEHKKRLSSRKLFMRGLITNTLNPKVALFFMAFLPQFVSPEAVGTPVPFLVLGTVFGLCALLFLILLGLFSGSVGQYLQSRPALNKWITNISGGIMISLGVRLAFVQRDM